MFLDSDLFIFLSMTRSPFDSFNEFIVSDTVINIGISILHKIEHEMIEDIMINMNRGSHKAANYPFTHVNGVKLLGSFFYDKLLFLTRKNAHLLRTSIQVFIKDT